jgi:hypothetical protein
MVVGRNAGSAPPAIRPEGWNRGNVFQDVSRRRRAEPGLQPRNGRSRAASAAGPSRGLGRAMKANEPDGVRHPARPAQRNLLRLAPCTPIIRTATYQVNGAAVLAVGFEPTRAEAQQGASLSRLPVSPRQHPYRGEPPATRRQGRSTRTWPVPHAEDVKTVCCVGNLPMPGVGRITQQWVLDLDPLTAARAIEQREDGKAGGRALRALARVNSRLGVCQ